MNAQPDLFAQPQRRIQTPVARHSDPFSSHAAAEHVTRSGKRQAWIERVTALVREHPGMTSMELAHISSLDRHDVAKRLPDAATAGMVQRGKQRKCSITGNRAMEWWPV